MGFLKLVEMRAQGPSQLFEITFVSENDATCFVTVFDYLYTIGLSFSLTIQPTTTGHFRTYKYTKHTKQEKEISKSESRQQKLN
jgi:hypothetical protein